MLRPVAELHDDGGDHLQTEGDGPGRSGERLLLLEDVLLNPRPPGAAELHRPGSRPPALGVEDLLPAHPVVAFEMLALVHLVANVRGEILGQELTHLVLKRLLLGRERDFQSETSLGFFSPLRAEL